MEDAAERMGALKRAYTEVILNLTKESAARVLSAEIKVTQLQKELASSKEEAVRTLLRVMAIMKAKISETQKASLLQAWRIQNLEALLDKSRYMIKSLQEELEKVKEKMEMTKTNHEEPHSEVELKQCDKQENALCHEISSNSLEPNLVETVSPERECICDHKLHPTIVQLKEPDLLGPGRKQRVRAFEHNMVAEELCNGHEDSPLKCLLDKNVTDQPPQIINYDIDETVTDAGKINISIEAPPNVLLSSLSLRNRKKIKSKRLTDFVASDKIMVSCGSLNNSRNSDQCYSNVSLPSGGETESKSLQVLKVEKPSDTDMKFLFTDEGVERGNGKVMHKPPDPMPSLVEASADPELKVSSKINLEKTDVSQQTLNSQGGFAKLDDLSQSPSSRLLKYKFKRKRLKHASTSANEDVVNVKSKNTWEKDPTLLEDQKSISLRASPFDDTTQVACQLVSLSKTRWE